ncbi:MAG: methionine--tRNA ligase, partial [bacterium]
MEDLILARGRYYITTPIYFVNDRPHIGHAYTTIAADVAARFQRMSGKEVFFLTGTDEHGLKIQRSAQAAGKTPLALADEMSGHFQVLWKRLNISNDDFIRTTQARHKRVCSDIFEKICEQGDIYLGEYEDWYCAPCESFWTEGQLLDGGNCPDCRRPTEKLREKSYFFRLSRYQEPVLKYIEENPEFIIPSSRRNEITSFIKGGLKDLSISRATLDWGVPVPHDPAHVMYVWFDALTNYISALDYPEGEKYKKFYPADVHLMSKDIIRFHAVYWPAFLMSAGLPLPKKVVVHGWWTVEGKKMSKSLGNAIDPHHLADEFGIDQLRFFLLREASFGKDGDFSRSAMIGRINTELANELGN